MTSERTWVVRLANAFWDFLLSDKSQSVCSVLFHSDEAMDLEDWKRSRSESSTAADDLESTYMQHKVCTSTWQQRSLAQNYLYQVINTFICCDSNSDYITTTSFRIFLLTIPYMAQWLRFCATNRKVAGSIPDGVIAIFHWHNPSDCTVALGSTQPLTEMSTRSIFWG